MAGGKEVSGRLGCRSCSTRLRVSVTSARAAEDSWDARVNNLKNIRIHTYRRAIACSGYAEPDQILKGVQDRFSFHFLSQKGRALKKKRRFR